MSAPTDATPYVRLYSSWRGVVFAFLTPALLLGVAALAVLADGFSPVADVIIVLGVGMLAIGLLDFPLYTTLAPSGITRRTLLRAHSIPWTSIAALNRARGGRRKRRAGPLVAAIGRRRYLLVDQVESPDEYEAIRKLCDSDAIPVPLVAIEPAPGTPPTWLYHRKRADQV